MRQNMVIEGRTKIILRISIAKWGECLDCLGRLRYVKENGARAIIITDIIIREMRWHYDILYLFS